MKTTVDTEPKIYAAQNELIALAVAVRPDWTAAQVSGAIVDAKTCGRTWAQVVVGLSRLMVDPLARPSELTPPAPDPQRSNRPTQPVPAAAHADELERARIDCERATAAHKAAMRGDGS